MKRYISWLVNIIVPHPYFIIGGLMMGVVTGYTILVLMSVVVFYKHDFTITTLAAPVFLMILFGGVIFPIYIGECLSFFPEMPASANACLFSLLWLVVGVFTVFASLLKVHSLLPFALSCMGSSIFALLLYYMVLRRDHRHE